MSERLEIVVRLHECHPEYGKCPVQEWRFDMAHGMKAVERYSVASKIAEEGRGYSHAEILIVSVATHQDTQEGRV